MKNTVLDSALIVDTSVTSSFYETGYSGLINFALSDVFTPRSPRCLRDLHYPYPTYSPNPGLADSGGNAACDPDGVGSEADCASCADVNECDDPGSVATCGATERCENLAPSKQNDWGARFRCVPCGANSVRQGDSLATGSEKCVCGQGFVDDTHTGSGDATDTRYAACAGGGA